MKLVAFLMMFTCLSAQAFFARECKNDRLRDGEIISWNLENCINNNFWQIETRFSRLFLDNCRAFPRNRVDFRFERCINDNFRKIEFAEPTIFVRHCNNFRRDSLDDSFLRCINRNFKDIERDLRFRR